jgi:hypothetical protein
MDPEIKSLLLKNIALSEENNDMLKKLRGAQKRAETMKILYWVLIIGISVFSYYSIQPYLKQVTETYSGIADSTSDLKDLLNN